MGQYVLLAVVALTVGAVVFGITVLVSGGDPGLASEEPDGRSVPLPGTRPLIEDDISRVRFDTALRGYRMAQVDQALRRAAYDIGYKDELIGVLEAEVTALREGRADDAEVLRKAREAALAPVEQPAAPAMAQPAVVQPTVTVAPVPAEPAAAAAEPGARGEEPAADLAGADADKEEPAAGTVRADAGTAEPTAGTTRTGSATAEPDTAGAGSGPESTSTNPGPDAERAVLTEAVADPARGSGNG